MERKGAESLEPPFVVVLSIEKWLCKRSICLPALLPEACFFFHSSGTFRLESSILDNAPLETALQ